MMEACHYTFVQTQRAYSTESDLKVNYGFGMILMCQWKFIFDTECATLGSDVDDGKAVWGQEYMGILHTFLSILV